jgi:hypothetical protein
MKAGITATTLVTSVVTASAQNILEAVFGRLWNPSPIAFPQASVAERPVALPPCPLIAASFLPDGARYLVDGSLGPRYDLKR